MCNKNEKANKNEKIIWAIFEMSEMISEDMLELLCRSSEISFRNDMEYTINVLANLRELILDELNNQQGGGNDGDAQEAPKNWDLTNVILGRFQH